MSLLVIGTLAYDTIETAYARRENVLGGSAVYFALAAAKYASQYISDRFLPDKVRAAGAGVAALRWWRRCWADTECMQWAGFTCVLKWGMHLLPLPAGTHIPPAETAPLLPPPPASPASPLCRPST